MLDTNFILSLFIQRQYTDRAKELLNKFIANKNRIFVPQQAIAETVYVLENIHKADSSIGKLSKREIKEMLESLIDTPKIKIEKEIPTREALDLYHQLNISFGDCLIYTTAKQNHISSIATFDANFDRLDIEIVH